MLDPKSEQKCAYFLIYIGIAGLPSTWCGQWGDSITGEQSNWTPAAEMAAGGTHHTSGVIFSCHGWWYFEEVSHHPTLLYGSEDPRQADNVFWWWGVVCYYYTSSVISQLSFVMHYPFYKTLLSYDAISIFLPVKPDKSGMYFAWSIWCMIKAWVFFSWVWCGRWVTPAWGSTSGVGSGSWSQCAARPGPLAGRDRHRWGVLERDQPTLAKSSGGDTLQEHAVTHRCGSPVAAGSPAGQTCCSHNPARCYTVWCLQPTAAWAAVEKYLIYSTLLSNHGYVPNLYHNRNLAVIIVFVYFQ